MNKRQKQVEEAKLAAEAYELRQLKAIYNKAAEDIANKIEISNGTINFYLKNFDELDEVQKSIVQSQIYQKQFQESLQKQINGYLSALNAQQYKSIDEYLNKCYKTGYIGSMYDIAGQGIPVISPIDQKKVTRAMVHNSPISEGLYAKLGVDTTVLKKRIANNIARGISTASDYRTIARNINLTANIGFNKAMRIARTEGHRIQCEAALDAQYAAKAAGADIVKQWDAALDANTRETHRMLDGQIKELDEPFEVDGMQAMNPAGFGIAAMDINCRCALLQRAKWALDADELEVLRERAAAHGLYIETNNLASFMLGKSQSFTDFENKYLKATDIFTEAATRVTTEFVPAKTIAEAEEFAAQYVDPSGFGSVGLSYKGIHIDVANEINKALFEVYSTFDIEKLNGIAAPAKNTKLGKLINAHAAYSPVRKSLLMNRANTKNLKVFMAGFDEDAKALKSVLEHPERYDFSKLRSTTRTALEASKETGRLIVPTNAKEAVFHEMGHHFMKVVDIDIDAKASMAKYGKKISGYAASDVSEYIAESFVSYMKGENRIDPALKKIFDGMRKVPAANYAKDVGLFPIADLPRNGQKLRPNTLLRELEKSEIGRSTIDYLDKNNLKVNIRYGRVPEKERAFQIGDVFQLNVSNIKDDTDAAMAIIHEVTHHRYKIGSCQWAEVVCFIQEYKHLYNINKLSFSQKKAIIKAVKKEYSELNWKKGGYRDGIYF